MGYSKNPSTTRGKKRWRWYINVNGKQIVFHCETEKQAKYRSEKYNKMFWREKRMENGFEDILNALIGLGMRKTPKEPLYVVRFGCAIKMDQSDDRCDKHLRCDHYEDCLDMVLREGYTGWNGRVL